MTFLSVRSTNASVFIQLSQLIKLIKLIKLKLNIECYQSKICNESEGSNSNGSFQTKIYNFFSDNWRTYFIWIIQSTLSFKKIHWNLIYKWKKIVVFFFLLPCFTRFVSYSVIHESCNINNIIIYVRISIYF